MKKILFLFILTSIIFSCKKEKIIEQNPEFVGYWIQQTDEGLFHKLDIRSESKGTFYECSGGATGDCADTQFRKWRIKNNDLYYGIGNNLGEIMQYPTTATIDILFGNNDTIKTGKRYMILNYSYYVEE